MDTPAPHGHTQRGGGGVLLLMARVISAKKQKHVGLRKWDKGRERGNLGGSVGLVDSGSWSV